MTLFILSLIPWFIYLELRTKKALHMLQQNLYDDDFRYLKWIIRNGKRIFGGKDLILLISLSLILLINLPFMEIIFSLLYIIIFIVTYNIVKKRQHKKPLVVTARVKRLIVTITLIYIIPFYIIFNNFNKDLIYLYYVYLKLLIYFHYLIVLLAVKINIPVEKCVYYYYKRKAKNKITSMTNLKIIGITGSYGKTTSKNILAEILNTKYNALPTPKSLNTMYGLMITINNHLDKFDDIFIAEMGAYKRGEIKQLCNFVKPRYAILTTIGKAHLELFGSQTNIQKGKFELIESLPNEGVAVLNGDDPLQLEYQLKNNCKLIWIGINNEDVDIKANNIKMSHRGTSFDVTFKGSKQKYTFKTKLLGHANVYNILASIALGDEFGISKEQLQSAVRGLKPTENRLELKKQGDITIIDNAYSSNEIGAKMALDVLKMMPGKKIIITPGMVELGKTQDKLNRQFGQQIADVCDEVILVGEKQTKHIQQGLKDKKYNKDNLHIVKDVNVAFNTIHKLKEKDTYVLIENDLPDIFNE